MTTAAALAVNYDGGPASPRESHWAVIAADAPVLSATMLRYLDQIAVSLRPATVTSAEVILRRFAGWLVSNHPEIVGLADVERRHIEAFKRFLPTLPGRSGRPPLSDATIRMTLGTLRTFFERVSQWGYPDTPTRVLIFNGDLPTPDAPLPKFLTDPDAAKLMRTAAVDADPVRRLVVEMLARTGLRVGELCNLARDAVVFINQRHWLRVPVGKLHNDRYIPLHPQLVELIDEHLEGRSDDIDRLIIWNGSAMNRHQITRIVNQMANVAGIGHIHPHQLRHTLATQAINRGMSLEALAALLGHKTLRMTLVYARIADRTVADAYDTVTDQIDALYNQPAGLRTDGNGSAGMAQLAVEYDHTMLGNGWCNRPALLDCQFESICETCAYYTTDTTFNAVLQAQHDHAAQRDQHHRVDLFQMLIDRWPNGFVCPVCGWSQGWRIADGRFSCGRCVRKVSVTSGTIFHGTRTPLTSWFAAVWYMTSQKNGVSALGLQQVLGLGSYRTAWTMMHKLRTAMVRPDRDLLSGDVEVDESYLGGVETGRRGGRQRDSTKEIVVIGVEVHSPKGFGRVRLRRVADLSAVSLVGFVTDVVEPGSVIITDGWNSYRPLSRHGYTHKRISIRAGDDPAHVVLPGVHRVASLLKRWLMGTHQGAIRPEHLDAYLEEFTFRFNRRSSRRRGLLFYRLLEQAVVTDPTPYKDIVGGGVTTEIPTQSSELY